MSGKRLLSALAIWLLLLNAVLPSGETVRLRCQHRPQSPLVAD
jgi:hypothetical protein